MLKEMDNFRVWGIYYKFPSIGFLLLSIPTYSENELFPHSLLHMKFEKFKITANVEHKPWHPIINSFCLFINGAMKKDHLYSFFFLCEFFICMLCSASY